MVEILDLAVPPDFLKERLLATVTFQTDQEEIWVWAKKTVAQWLEGQTSFDTMLKDYGRIQGLLQRERPGTDDELGALHTLTVQCLRLIRSYYQDDSVTIQRLAHLTPRGDDRDDIVKEAEALVIAWEELPEADRDRICRVTLAVFKAKLESADARLKALTKLESDERNLRVDLHHLGNSLWEDCKDWYSAALVVFPAETPEGQKLRANIPTQEDEVSQSSGGTSTMEIPARDPAS